MVMSMEIGLVLGGGGARGFAHIGTLRALEEYGFEPVAIAGCSMGAIVGALYAAGHGPEALLEIAKATSFPKLLDVGELGGLIGGKGIEKMLAQHLPDTFEDLSLPFAVTAVDIQRGKLVILRHGELVPAVRASSALPGILSPVRHEGHILMDGGLLNNLPVDLIGSMTLEPVIAVDVGAPPNRQLNFGEGENFWERMRGLFTSGQRALTIELFIKSVEIPQAVITDMRLAMHPPELLIRPDLPDNLKPEEFLRLEEALEIGYRSTCEALEHFPQDDTTLPATEQI